MIKIAVGLLLGLALGVVSIKMQINEIILGCHNIVNTTESIDNAEEFYNHQMGAHLNHYAAYFDHKLLQCLEKRL